MTEQLAHRFRERELECLLDELDAIAVRARAKVIPDPGAVDTGDRKRRVAVVTQGRVEEGMVWAAGHGLVAQPDQELDEVDGTGAADVVGRELHDGL